MKSQESLIGKEYSVKVNDVIAFALVPQEPILFYEIDQPHSLTLFNRIKDTLNDIYLAFDLNHQIYETKHGYHIVVEAYTWEQVIDLRNTFLSWIDVNYFDDNPTKAALRVTRKADITTGETISPAPKLIHSSIKGLGDLRKSVKTDIEIYRTTV